MTTRKLTLLAFLVVVPIALHGQGRRGGGGGGGADRGFKAGGSTAEANALINSLAESPSVSKDLQKANPLETLLDKKKDLKLSSDEEKEIKTLNSALKDEIKPYLKTIDSVAREMKKEGDYAPTQGQMLIGRKLTRESADSVMTKYRAAADAAIEKLAEEHRQPATDLLLKEMAAQQAARRGGRPPV